MKGGKTNIKKDDHKLAVKKPAAFKAAPGAKDPNKPKRAASAFFVFMEDFRKMYKEKYPLNKSAPAVGKAAGEKWKSMSDDEKRPFVAIAEKRKAEYEKQMKVYNKKQAHEETKVEEDSDKSKSEVHDKDDDDDAEDSDEEDDD